MSDEPKRYRYAVFEIEQYYPRGGFDDCVGLFETLKEAQAARPGFGIIIDLEAAIRGGGQVEDFEFGFNDPEAYQ